MIILCCYFSAPQGCVQYFLEPTGTFTTYAYQNSQMLVNQLYATCFRKNLGKMIQIIVHLKFKVLVNNM